MATTGPVWTWGGAVHLGRPAHPAGTRGGPGGAPPHLELPARLRRQLEADLGPATGPVPVPVPEASVRLPPVRLPPEAAAALRAAAGTDRVRTDPAARLRRAAGSSYLDLVRLRSGVVEHAPDAVVRPANADAVVAVLAACAAHDVAVVPYGGGTSVVGGVAALAGSHRAVVSLDLADLDAVLEVDETSLLARVQPGLRGPALEAALAERGLTLGHQPQSFELATLGGYAATRSAGQASTGHGRFEEMVVGLELATPAGRWRLGRGAASAAGPDLTALVLGSEGVFGVVTELTVRLRRRPAAQRWQALAVPGFPAGLDLVRSLVQQGLAPAVVRLSDPEETRVSLAQASPPAGPALAGYLRGRRVEQPCLLLLGFEGSPAGVRAHRRGVRAALLSAGAVRLPAAVARAWERGRYRAPYLRDQLLDAGVAVETLETSATWTDLPGLHAAVRAAARSALDGPGLVLAHVSHLYPHGASLYVTVLARQAGDPVAQWTAVKQAATEALLAHGGTITHHHAVGTDHRRWLPAEIGGTGVAVLRAVKDVLDPTGVLNPGKLIPEPP